MKVTVYIEEIMISEIATKKKDSSDDKFQLE